MYGVILMVAMTGGAESPALFNRGCKGCSGYSCSGCSGCYGGCSGKHHRRHKSCHGCHGHSCCGYTSCYGSSCYGSSCYGSSCYGSSCYGSYSAPVVGSYDSPAVIAPSYPMAPEAPMPPIPPAPPVKGKGIEKLKKAPTDDETVQAAPALITINVPAEARLLIDGATTVSNSETRVFESPTLLVGKSYTYTFQAEFVRDGKSVVVTREVKVKAGSEITVSMLNADTTVASR